MIRKILTGTAALALMVGPAFAQDSHYDRDHHYDRDSHYGDRVASNTVRGGLGGAGVGALIGCLVTIPIGCGPGAAVGAAWGGGGGAVIGAATTHPPRSDYSRHESDYPPSER
ncbi:MAG TPA: hypothetical protein VFE18_05055 [Phenylobacterium sp.]|jgi:hypothetical protein|uniref:hypothetical protein n=1 Tax=Phenylobacterium sp. TaxID=1871053 RepID=UPI002D350CBA|nr:hypothetical protein [Phenylobacterium sp.]HZZ67522.1 hypothetical protein [Phenylobacterium sp.]